MKLFFKIHFFPLAATAFMLTGCDQSAAPEEQPAEQNGLLSIYTVNYPLQYFAQRIGGKHINATYPGPADIDPAYWQPEPETVLDYQQADLIVLNGAGYADWVKRVSLPLTRQLDTSTTLSDQLLPVKNKTAHTHGPGGEHVHDDLAFTLWLDPELAAAQAIAIHAELVKQLPNQAEELNGNLAALTGELWDLHAGLKEAFEATGQQKIIYSHPVYQYLNRRYRLDGLSLHWEPGKMPDDKEFAQLEDLQGALMIWEAEPLPEISQRLTSMGIESVVFETCATKPASGDYLSRMQLNLERLQSVSN